MNIVKQQLSICTVSGISSSFCELEIIDENDTQYVVTGINGFEVISKCGVIDGNITLDKVYAGETNLARSGFVNVFRYKLDLPESDLNFEHDFDFYEIANLELPRFESTKDLWVNRNGDVEPRYSEVAA